MRYHNYFMKKFISISAAEKSTYLLGWILEDSTAEGFIYHHEKLKYKKFLRCITTTTNGKYNWELETWYL